MQILLWLLVLIASVWAADWGSDCLADPLQKLRRQWGLSEAAGAAFVALATASPEIGTNTAAAVRRLSDIGLGNLLGSNIISVPVIVLVAYLASFSGNKKSRQHYLKVKPEALKVQALPYIIIIALAAVLTVPAPWRGLQPIDGWIMLAAYFIYLAQAIIRKRQSNQRVNWQKQEILIALAGILALAIAAYFIVTATEQLVQLFGISQIIGGLFITSTLSVAPEAFATWKVAKSGQVTAATTSVIADNTATMTLALFPLALIGLQIQDLRLFVVNLIFVALLAIAYALFISWGKHENSFEWWEVLILVAIYLTYLALMIFVIL